jgi:MOSC domain-containing protein YiiM
MTGGLPHVELRHVLAGKSRPFTRSGSATGIDKVSLSGAVEVGRLGIVGDEQGGRRIHGGIDKAIHHYPFEHYQTWVELIGEHPRLAARRGERRLETGNVENWHDRIHGPSSGE